MSEPTGTLAATATTVKPPVRVAVPLEVVTETFLAPRVAASAIVILAVIWVALSTVKLFTVTPEPKVTAVAPVRYVPVMVTIWVWP
jgi:hypothetical protein